LVCVVSAAAASPASAQAVGGTRNADALHNLNTAIESLTTKVAPSVVQLLVTGYRAVDDANRGDAGLVIGRQRTVGSGAIIDPDGYIVTNAHVVTGAQQVHVVLRGLAAGQAPLQALALEFGKAVPAQIVGIARDIDLALLKIDAAGLPALSLANYDHVRQGELVFAFGSPEGLRNSVSMGVVSSAARQLDPDSPSVYVQTDAPINPGNSGGPLVNVDGELVGLNTFILSESGGSQGLGFAIPSAVIAAAYPQLRKYGHLHRGIIGLSVQAITPALADGLGLSRTFGVVVSDVQPDSPADRAGVQVRDIVVAVDEKPIESVPVMTLALGARQAGETVALGLIRDRHTLSVPITVIERPHQIDQLSDLGDPDTNAIPKLGIVGADVDERTKILLPDLRIPSGVLVTARRQGSDVDSPLMAGDVIHAVNAYSVRSVDGLQVLMEASKSNSQIVLQIERNQRLLFLTMTIY
jgi:serine protease Do